MKLLIALIFFSTAPALAQNANGSSGATTYGPTSGGASGPVGSTSVSPPTSRATSSDARRELNRAEKEGASTKKTGGATITFGPEDDSADGGPTKTSPSNARTAVQELKTGTSSTGGTGTSMNDAGEGSITNTTGTGAIGSDSGGKRNSKRRPLRQ